MPAYNAEHYITSSIESILKQTFGDFELLIVDDQSTDRTWEIIENASKGDSRIKIFRNSENLGVAKTRNFLIREATGDYIAWQDADDVSVLTRISDEYEFMEKNQSVAIVGGYLEFIDERGRALRVRSYPEGDRELRKNIFKFSPVAQPVAMIRKSMLMKTALFDPDLKQAEDLDLSFKLGREGKFANIPKVLLKYRYYPSSLSANKLRENILSTLRVRKKALREYEYTMSVLDYGAYLATWGVQFLPPALVQKLFPLLRKFFI